MQCCMVLYIQNRTQPHQVFKRWGKKVIVPIVAYVLALRLAACISRAWGEGDAMSCSLLLVLQWYLLAVNLSQAKYRWERLIL